MNVRLRPKLPQIRVGWSSKSARQLSSLWPATHWPELEIGPTVAAELSSLQYRVSKLNQSTYAGALRPGCQVSVVLIRSAGASLSFSTSANNSSPPSRWKLLM